MNGCLEILVDRCMTAKPTASHSGFETLVPDTAPASALAIW